jgi:hypothetical protein
MRKNWLKSGWIVYWLPFAEADEILRSYLRVAARAGTDPLLSKIVNANVADILAAAGFESTDSLVEMVLAARERIYSIETDRAIHFVFAYAPGQFLNETNEWIRALNAQIKSRQLERGMLEQEAGTSNPNHVAYVIPLLQAEIELFRKAVIAFALLGIVAHRWGQQTRCKFCYRASIPGRRTCRKHPVRRNGKRLDNERRHAMRALAWLKEHKPFSRCIIEHGLGNPDAVNDLLHAEDVPARFSTRNKVLPVLESRWNLPGPRMSLFEELDKAPRVTKLLGETRPVDPALLLQWLRDGLDPDCVNTSIYDWIDKIGIAEEWLEALEQTKRECRRGRPVSTETKVVMQDIA